MSTVVSWERNGVTKSLDIGEVVLAFQEDPVLKEVQKCFEEIYTMLPTKSTAIDKKGITKKIQYLVGIKNCPKEIKIEVVSKIIQKALMLATTDSTVFGNIFSILKGIDGFLTKELVQEYIRLVCNTNRKAVCGKEMFDWLVENNHLKKTNEADKLFVKECIELAVGGEWNGGGCNHMVNWLFENNCLENNNDADKLFVKKCIELAVSVKGNRAVATNMFNWLESNSLLQEDDKDFVKECISLAEKHREAKRTRKIMAKWLEQGTKRARESYDSNETPDVKKVKPDPNPEAEYKDQMQAPRSFVQQVIGREYVTPIPQNPQNRWQNMVGQGASVGGSLFVRPAVNKSIMGSRRASSQTFAPNNQQNEASIASSSVVSPSRGL